MSVAAQPDRLFLDANIHVSAAYRPGSMVERLWSVANIELVTTVFAVGEARIRLPPPRHAELDRLLNQLARVDPVILPHQLALVETLVPEKNVPILVGAIAARATHLITGDKRHFGALFGKRIEGVLILSPRENLALHGSA